MNEMIHVSKKHKIEFTICKRNHIWIYIMLDILDKTGNILRTDDDEERKKIFMFDTGAQNTILSKKRIDMLGYNYCEIKGKTRVSAGGGIFECSRIEIPDLVITDGIVVHKPVVLVPDDYASNINILGQDILQLFNYYVDNRSHKIYFDKENMVE